jgi:ribosomal protein S21
MEFTQPLAGVKIFPAPDEPIESIVRRFKKVTQKSQILADARRHEFFTPKGERRRLKSLKARNRRAT